MTEAIITAAIAAIKGLFEIISTAAEKGAITKERLAEIYADAMPVDDEVKARAAEIRAARKGDPKFGQ